MDTPFDTQLIRYLNPILNELGPKKLRSERKCSLDKAFVGPGRGGYTIGFHSSKSLAPVMRLIALASRATAGGDTTVHCSAHSAL